ncbi:MAG: redoxin family protein [Planctomycetaceae bacterium]
MRSDWEPVPPRLATAAHWQPRFAALDGRAARAGVLACLISLACGFSPPAFARETTRATSERKGPQRPTVVTWPLRAVDVAGEVQLLGDNPVPAAWSFLFLSPRCERSETLRPTLEKLIAAYNERQVAFLVVLADPDISRAEARAWAERVRLRVPVLFDGGGALAQELGATHTPQVVVIDPEGQKIYSGKIDDRYDRPENRGRPRQTFLASALKSAVAGRLPVVRRTEPTGRSLDPRPAIQQREQVNYARHIAPLVRAHCAECHQPQGLAPFPLLTYDDVRPQGPALVSLVKNHKMPPWKPVAGFGEFRHARGLSPAEVELVAAWVEAGLPPGDAGDLPPTPELTINVGAVTTPEDSPRSSAGSWRLGTPDLVLSAAEPIELSPTTDPVARRLVWKTNLDSEQFVAAVEFRAAAPRQIAEASVRLDLGEKARQQAGSVLEDGIAGGVLAPFAPAGSLGGWAPMALTQRLPDGCGRSLPPGADVVLDLTYHPQGREVHDLPELGLYFASSESRRPVGDLVVADLKLRIPPGAARYRQRARYELPVPTTLLGLTPHFGPLTREVTVVALLPDGSSERLLRIADWDPLWHDHYLLRRPVRYPAGTRIEVEAVFDNTPKNPRQPHAPPQVVRWGTGPGQEQATCFLAVTADSAEAFAKLREDNDRTLRQQIEAAQADSAMPTR